MRIVLFGGTEAIFQACCWQAAPHALRVAGGRALPLALRRAPSQVRPPLLAPGELEGRGGRAAARAGRHGRGGRVMAAPALDVASLFGVRGKACLVTGGGRGIGLMVAAGLVANGARVFICSRTAAVCDKVAAGLTARGPGTCTSLGGVDLSANDACVDLAKRLRLHTSELHVLVNNSGTSWGAPMDTFPDEGWDKVMSLNVKAIFNLTRACMPLLEAAATDADPARVVNVGSVAGIRPQLWPTYSYDASKVRPGELAGDMREHNCTAAVRAGCSSALRLPWQRALLTLACPASHIRRLCTTSPPNWPGNWRRSASP